MADFILLMHSDVERQTAGEDWATYLAGLRATGAFDGGSTIGEGACFRKAGTLPEVAKHIGGYLRVRAADLDAAKKFLEGNPVYECGGTVEIRALPND